jgi:hydrogenase maturation protein HypF
VLAENGWPLARGPVLGIALDGLGYGPDGTLWGGELLLADYRNYRRVGWLRPTPLPGGMGAMREPWRNTFAQIATGMGWETFRVRYGALELSSWLERQPLGLLATLMGRGIQAPLSSSCGRLCDAVAGALGICRDGVSYEGQAAMELETLANRAMKGVRGGYPFGVRESAEGLVLDPNPLWEALFADLLAGRDRALIAARFHQGLVEGLADLAERLARDHRRDTLALSGGVFQNRILCEGLVGHLRGLGLRVLTHRQVPSNDGGIALGQAAMAAARLVTEGTR